MTFEEALGGLDRGDFSWLEPVFEGQPPPVVTWHRQGLFHSHPQELAEALTCACFLGKVETAEHLLRRGVAVPGGAKTGMNAFHWAANRGQLEAVRLLMRWKAPWEPLNMYGGNVLETVAWSALHEPRTGQMEVIEELLRYGARLQTAWGPTGNGALDALLQSE